MCIFQKSLVRLFTGEMGKMSSRKELFGHV
jgi:hypothetical protein